MKAEGKAKSGVMYLPLLNKTIDFAISPRTVIAHKSEESRWTFATGMYTPYATGANHSRTGDPTRYGSRRAVQQHLIYQHPTASYQVTPELSLGIGVGAGQTAQVRNPSAQPQRPDGPDPGAWRSHRRDGHSPLDLSLL
jgi:long-subunit fatty acid transport protein